MLRSWRLGGSRSSLAHLDRITAQSCRDLEPSSEKGAASRTSTPVGLRSARGYDSLDLRGRSARVLMGPHTNDHPTRGAKFPIGVPIAANVRGQLRIPPRSVLVRLSSMLRAGVPEASIDEDCDSRPAEHDVGSPSRRTQGRRVDRVSKALPVEDLANQQLAGSVAPLRCHHAAVHVTARRARRGCYDPRPHSSTFTSLQLHAREVRVDPVELLEHLEGVTPHVRGRQLETEPGLGVVVRLHRKPLQR